MTNIVYKKSYSAPEVDRREILRYAGVREESQVVGELLDGCLAVTNSCLSYKVCYALIPTLRIPELFKNGADALLSKLAGCEYALVFAATVGMEMDRLIKRTQNRSQATALLMQAIGTERVESLCDLFEGEVRDAATRCGVTACPRFSPGYGKLPLEMQKDVFSLLSPSLNIGVSLCDSLLMTPSKSVTAIIGLSGNVSELCGIFE